MCFKIDFYIWTIHTFVQTILHKKQKKKRYLVFHYFRAELYPLLPPWKPLFLCGRNRAYNIHPQPFRSSFFFIILCRCHLLLQLLCLLLSAIPPATAGEVPSSTSAAHRELVLLTALLCFGASWTATSKNCKGRRTSSFCREAGPAIYQQCR